MYICINVSSDFWFSIENVKITSIYQLVFDNG